MEQRYLEDLSYIQTPKPELYKIFQTLIKKKMFPPINRGNTCLRAHTM